MGQIIAVANQKGGVGKSTTALILSEILGSRGKIVLLVDLDAQGNSTYASGAVHSNKTVTDVLSGGKAEAAIVKTKYYDILPSDQYLVNVERSENVSPTLIKDCIKPITGVYDFIIIDTPPALGNLMYGSLVASDHIIIPIEARPFSLQGLTALNNTIASVQNAQNPHLKILGILLIKYNLRTVLNRDIKAMLEEYAAQIGTKIFKTAIREGIVVPESQIQQMPLIDYAPKSNPVQDYKALAAEIFKEIGE